MNAVLKSNKSLWPVYEFRPLANSGPWLRYANGHWIPDDGEFDVAFVSANSLGAPLALRVELPYCKNIIWSYCRNGNRGAHVAEHPRGNAWHYMLRAGASVWGGDWGLYAHENHRVGEIAMNKCCGMYRCANGRGPEFYIKDPYIAAGLLRDRDTKTAVTFPKVFRCMYCGDIELPEKQQ